MRKLLYLVLSFALFTSTVRAACPTPGATVVEVCNDLGGNGIIRAYFFDGNVASSYILFSLSPPGPVSNPFGPITVNTAIPLPPGAIAGVEFGLVPNGDYIIRVNCNPAGTVNIGGFGINVDSSLGTDATINPAGPFCVSDAPVNLTAATGGGIWSGTGITDANAGTFDPSVAGAGNHTITYTITIGNCIYADTEVITVDNVPDATITPQGPFCVTDPSTNLAAATGGGTWSGVGITNGALGTFDPATAGVGSHLITYSVTVGACTSMDTETIIVDPVPNATITPAGPFCNTDAALNLTAATGGGVWSGTGITNAALGTFDPAIAGAGSHLITYTLTVGACTAVDTETIDVDPAPDATITPAGPFCITDPATNLVAASGGGTWSGTGITDGVLGTFDPATAGGGSHVVTYTITLGACVSVDTETIVVDLVPDATITPAGPFCISDAAVNLVAATGGGTWSGTGITNAALGTFNPAIAGAGSHMITYTLTVGACTSVDTETIDVDPIPDATITPAGPFCITDPSLNLVAATGGGTWSGTGITNGALGTFDPATAGAGSHLITYTLTVGACTAVDTETIVVDPVPDATITPAGPFCISDAALNLVAATGGGTWSGTGITNAALGTFNPSIAGAGSHIITYTLTVGACTSVDTETIDVDPAPDATITPAGPFCITDPSLNLTAATGGGTWSGTGITNGVLGTFDPAAAGAGSHLVTYTLTVGACTSVDTETIVVDPVPNATITPAGPFCITDAALNLVAATGGGTWSGTGITNGALGTFDPATAGAGSHLITYTLTVGACTSVDTETVVVDTPLDPTITPAGPFCITDPALNLIAATGGGTWTGTGITNGALGTFDPATAGAGSHLVTYTLVNGGCTTMDTETIVVDPSPDATITPAGPFCLTDPSLNLVAATTGGTWSGTGITDGAAGTFDPATAGAGSHLITYTLSVGACTSVDTETIVVDTPLDPTITPAGPFCITDPAFNLVAATGGGTWTGTGITNGALGTFDPATAGAGSHLVTYTLVNGGCTTMDTETIVVDPSPDATITPAGPFCLTDPSLNLVAATIGGTWSGTGITDGAAGTFDPATAGAGNHLITYTITIGSCTSVDTETVTVSSPLDPTITLSGPYCDNGAPVILAAASPGGTWSGTGITNAGTGEFSPSVAGAGSHLITYTVVNGGCTTVDTETFVVNTIATATLSGGANVCVGQSATLTVTLSGVAPWDIQYSDGGAPVTITGILTSPHTFSVSPVISSTYTLVSVVDAQCGAGTISGSANVNVSPIAGNPATFGSETWLAYVYDDSGSPAPPVTNIDYTNTKYRGFLNETEIGSISAFSSYNTTTDAFNLNLSNTIPVAGPNICGSYLNDYSIRFRMTKTFTAGVYTFSVGADDGVRMFIDGGANILTIPAAPASFSVHAFTTYTSAPQCLTAGTHNLVIEYFDRGGFSRIDFNYSAAPAPAVTTPVSVCVNSPTPTLTASSVGAIDYKWYTDAALTNPPIFTGANYTPAGAQLDMAVVGTTNFFVTAVYACGETPAAQVTVDVINGANIVLPTPPVQICDAGGIVDLTTLVSATPMGGTFTFSGTGITTSPNFDPAGLSGTTSTISVNYVSGTCSASTTFDIDVVGNATITASTATVCESAGLVDLNTLVSGNPLGGAFTFAGTGVTGSDFDPSGLSGLNTITVDYTIGGCIAPTQMFDIDVIPNVSLVVDNSTTVCPSSGPVDLSALVTPTPTGGSFTFTGTGVTGTQFDPSGSAGSTVTINVSYDIGGCSAASTVQVMVRTVADPLCGGPTGNCATVIITPVPTAAICSPTDGSIMFNINPATPTINNTGVRIGIVGISPSNTGVSQTNFNDQLFTGLPIGTYDYTIEYGDPSCIKTGQVTVLLGPDVVDFTVAANSVNCFGTAGGVILSNINGSSVADYTYEVTQSGTIVQTGSITQLQSLGDVTVSGLGSGNFEIKLAQDQSATTSCTSPVQSALKPFTVTTPAASLDTLYVNKNISVPDLPTGSMLVGIAESLQEPYEVRLELTQPLFPGQVFAQDFTVANRNPLNLKVEFQAPNLYAGVYQLSLRDAIGCQKDYLVTIDVDNNLMIPNIFTPNGDGVNEVFFIRNMPDATEVIVSNRWGKQVYKSSNYQNDWDGGDIEDGVYYYRIKAAGQSYSGWVELLRGK